MIQAVTILLLATAIYLALGLVFAIPFIIKGVTKTDETAQGSGWGFRLIIIPGTMVFWPLLLKKWITVSKRSLNDKRAA